MKIAKDCPFCGEDIGPVVARQGTKYTFYQVMHQPNKKGHRHGLIIMDVDEWNTRPIEDALTARITELEQELNTTDGLLKEATETIGAVVACCTYNSNDDAKIGIYGIDQKAFTRIDQFMTHYNDAISAGKVSVDVKRELTDAELKADLKNKNARIAALEAEIRNWQDCYCEFETIAPDGNLKISVLDLYNRLTELNARIAELEAENAALKAEPKPLEYWSDEKKQTYADNEGRSAKRSEE